MKKLFKIVLFSVFIVHFSVGAETKEGLNTINWLDSLIVINQIGGHCNQQVRHCSGGQADWQGQPDLADTARAGHHNHQRLHPRAGNSLG